MNDYGYTDPFPAISPSPLDILPSLSFFLYCVATDELGIPISNIAFPLSMYSRFDMQVRSSCVCPSLAYFI